MEHDLYLILMIYNFNKYNFDPYNVFLAIAINIPQRLKTGFGPGSHIIWSFIYYLYFIIYIT